MNIFQNKEIWTYSSILKNNNYNFVRKKILEVVSEDIIKDAAIQIKKWKNYYPTPLLNLETFAKIIGVKKIYYKDESKRFNLGSFKALGGAYAVDKIVGNKKDVIVSTATAGNHGRSVAWGTKRKGIKCKIFISENVSETRANEMRKYAAEIIRVPGNYENSLKECIKQSKKNNWEIVQDVSWKNYEYAPKLMLGGYTIMLKEISKQVKKNYPTHIILQAGVGGMAAGAIIGIAKYFKNIPNIIIVEPESASCVLNSIKNSKPTKVNIIKESLMGGMSCAEVSPLAWRILKNSVNQCISIPDKGIAPAIALLSKSKLSKNKIIGGECATPGIITLLAAHNNKDLKKKLNIKSDSKILIFGCEGATDKQIYTNLLNTGKQLVICLQHNDE